jgi:hypothetical protein
VKGTSQEQFNSRLQRALGEDSEPALSSPSITTPIAAQAQSSQPEPTSNTTPTAPIDRPAPAPAPAPVPAAAPVPASAPAPVVASPRPAVAPPAVSQSTPSQPSTTPQSPHNERPTQTESKGKQRAEPEPAPSKTNTTSTSRSDWIAQQKQKQSDSRRERDRILAQIEADKAERKARREEERRERLQEQGTTQSTTQSTVPQDRTSRRSNAAFTKLQVRLLDGATIREQFPADATITEHVRPWIDSHLETKAPYTFKQILAPKPARSISISEEQESLRELGLLPSATLVLQPIQSYTDAYGSAANNGGLLSLPYNAVTGAVGLVTGSLTGAARWLRGGSYEEPGPDGHVLGEQSETPQAEATPQTVNAATTGGTRFRTLADQRADRGEDQQFYNGNSLDFQPDKK